MDKTITISKDDLMKVEAKTITISKDDLMKVEAKILTEMTLDVPEILLISNILTEFSAFLVKKLFYEKED